MKNTIFTLAAAGVLLAACAGNNNNKVPGAQNQVSDKATPDVREKLDTVMKADGTNLTDAKDVFGTYKGTLPCADCEGIATELTLKGNNTFERTEEYLKKEKPMKSTGTWKWTMPAKMIELDEKGDKQVYKVTKNRLTLLGANNKENAGDMAAMYILKKQ